MPLTTKEQSRLDALRTDEAKRPHLGNRLAIMALEMLRDTPHTVPNRPVPLSQREIDAKTAYVDRHTCRVTRRKGCTCRYCF